MITLVEDIVSSPREILREVHKRTVRSNDTDEGNVDGDEVNCTILADNNMCELAHTLDPSYSVPGRNTINEVSGLLGLPKPTIATVTNYLNDEYDENIDEVGVLASMKRVEVDASAIIT